MVPTAPAPSAHSAAGRRFDSRAQEAYLNLWRTYDRLRVEEERLFGEFDLTPQQYNALRLLRGARPDGLRTLDLADRLVSRSPDITRMVDYLESRGWVDRSRPPQNRRVVLVILTEAGADLLRRLDRRVGECHQHQLGHLSDEQLRSLIALLREARRPHEPEDGFWRDV